ncbi:MAG: hypothetical protein ACE5KU_02190 [Nitrososphaerales archaeon]
MTLNAPAMANNSADTAFILISAVLVLKKWHTKQSYRIKSDIVVKTLRPTR